MLHARHVERGDWLCERVVRVKVWKWLGTDMEDYLRPETLFRPTHFDSYASESVPKPSGRKFDPNSPADQDERAKLRAKHGTISPERLAVGVNFLKHAIRETEEKLDRIVDAGEQDALARKLEDLRRELVYLESVKGMEETDEARRG